MEPKSPTAPPPATNFKSIITKDTKFKLTSGFKVARPLSTASCDDKLFVATKDGVFIVEEGKESRQIIAHDSEIYGRANIVVDESAKTLYVAITGRRTVKAFTFDGKLERVMTHKLDAFVTGIAFDSTAGLLYLCDYYGHSVRVFNRDGLLVRKLCNSEALRYPTSVVINSKRELIVGGRIGIVAVHADTGNFLRKIHDEWVGDGILSVDGADNILVANRLGSVLALTPDGKHIGTFPISQVTIPKDLSVYSLHVILDSRCRLVAADYYSNHVRVFQLNESTQVEPKSPAAPPPASKAVITKDTKPKLVSEFKVSDPVSAASCDNKLFVAIADGVFVIEEGKEHPKIVSAGAGDAQVKIRWGSRRR